MAKEVLFEAGPMLDPKKTGVGYYVDHLVSSLQSYNQTKINLTGYYFNFLNRHQKEPKASTICFYKIWLVPGKILSACRRLGFQPFLELFIHGSYETIVFTNYVALPQLRKRKTILVVYDLGFLEVPEFTQEANLKYLRKFCPPSIRNADIIITISEFTKQRIMYHFPDLKAQIIVTPIPPAETKVTQVPLNSRLRSMGIREKGYILYLGTIEPRKNLEQLVEAYGRLNEKVHKDCALVLAGGKGWKDQEILRAVESAQMSNLDVIMTGYITDDEKAALYSNACCFILPSHYEGFGMSLLEAMQYKVPVLASNIPVFNEVAGGAAIYFDKDAAGDIASKISLVLNDPGLRKDLLTKSKMQLEKFNWEENARRVLGIL